MRPFQAWGGFSTAAHVPPDVSDERPDEEAPPGLRKSRGWALGAFLATLTSLWLPWWGAEYEESTGYGYTFAAKPFGLGNAAEGTEMVAIWVTTVLVLIAAGWLFVRIAGKSWLYEADAWQRDLLIVAGVLVAAMVATGFWPTDLPFWGGRSYENLTEGATAEATFAPALGWWTAALAVLLLGVAYMQGRSRDSP